jgi:hypothetical protein
MLISSPHSGALVRYLKSRGVRHEYFDVAAWMTPNLAFSRFVRYGEMLRDMDPQYDRILMADVTDVLFQGHPLDTAPEGDLLVFIETAGRTINDCKQNRGWIETLYGPEVLARLGGNDISCVGTTIGDHSSVLQYIDRMVGPQPRPADARPLLNYWGHDQGIHNYLLYTGQLPGVRTVPNGTHVLTAGFVPDADVKTEGSRIVFGPQNVCPPIVHQYNYKPALDAFVASLYAMPPAFAG